MNLGQRQQALGAIRGAHFEFCGKAADILSRGGSLNLKDQTCAVARPQAGADTREI